MDPPVLKIVDRILLPFRKATDIGYGCAGNTLFDCSYGLFPKLHCSTTDYFRVITERFLPV